MNPFRRFFNWLRGRPPVIDQAVVIEAQQPEYPYGVPPSVRVARQRAEEQARCAQRSYMGTVVAPLPPTGSRDTMRPGAIVHSKPTLASVRPAVVPAAQRSRRIDDEDDDIVSSRGVGLAVGIVESLLESAIDNTPSVADDTPSFDPFDGGGGTFGGGGSDGGW